MGQLIRGYTDEIRMLDPEPLLGAVRDEWLDSVLHRLAQHTDAPARLFASVPTADALLNVGPNVVEMGDGAAKSSPPVEDSIGALVATTINMQTGVVAGGTVLMAGGGAFTLPASTLNYYRRLCLSIQGDGSLQANFSAENVSLPALANPGPLFSAMTGLPIGYVDLKCDNATGKYRTADSLSSIIENKVGSYHTITRFGAGGGGSVVEDAIVDGVTRKAPSQNAVYDAFAAEATARLNADSTLQSNINAEATLRTNADNAEITSRVNADSTLQANLNIEVTARTGADLTLQANLNIEVTARTGADLTLQANINSEITARVAADSTLQANLNIEVTARTNADSTLQANIDALKWNTYTTASPAASVADRDQVFWDTTAGICTATLPLSPLLGSIVRLIDFKGTWGTNKLVVARNGNKIQGATADLDLTIPWDTCVLVFDGVDNWHLLYG